MEPPASTSTDLLPAPPRAAPARADQPTAEPEGRLVKTGGRGPRARPPEHWSLLEFIASRGGISPDDPLIGDVRSMLGRSNKFIPGFGHLIRRNGQRLDRLREAALEARYLEDPAGPGGGPSDSTIATLLEAMDAELRGNRVYPQGVERPMSKAERAAFEESHRIAIERSLDAALDEVGIPPQAVPDELRSRVVQMIAREGESDVLIAYDRAVMERSIDETEAGPHDDIPLPPGWEGVPGDPGTAPRDGGGLADQGQDGAGAAARAAGERDRAPAEPGSVAGRAAAAEERAVLVLSVTPR
jgi:hypothetical protein